MTHELRDALKKAIEAARKVPYSTPPAALVEEDELEAAGRATDNTLEGPPAPPAPSESPTGPF